MRVTTSTKSRATSRTAVQSRVAAALLLVLLPASPARSHDGSAGTASTAAADLSRIRIDNFGRVNGSYYRGAEPDAGDYQDLVAIGIRTLVDLRGDDGDATEKLEAARAGLGYVQIPMSTRQAPTQPKLDEFLQVVTDPERQPVYVHCVGGRHRTGLMTALYRMARDGWSADQAFKEMKTFKFGPDFLHPEFKACLYRYAPDPARLGTTLSDQAVAR
jgi:protein tyrosine/serine phosphatase